MTGPTPSSASKSSELALASEPPKGSVRGQLFWLVTSVILITGAALAILLFYLRAQAVTAGERLTESIAHIVAEQTDSALHAIDLRLQLSQSNIKRLTSSGPLDAEAARQLLRAETAALPFLRALTVADANGRILYSSEPFPPGTEVSDRAYFQIYRQLPSTGLWVGPPVRSRLSGAWVLTATRPLRDPDGLFFEGVIIAAVNSTYFDRLWSEVNLGEGGSIALFRRDGHLMMRTPFNEAAVGRSFQDNPLFTRIATTPSATFRDTSPIDGRLRQLAYRALDGNPDLIVIVGQLQERVLGPWHQLAAITLSLWLVACLAVITLGHFLSKARHRRMASEMNVQLIAQRLSMATDASSIGVWDWDLRADRWYATPTYFALMGHDPDDAMTREQWLEKVHPEDREEANAHVTEALAGGVFSYRHESRILHTDGTYRWMSLIGRVLAQDERGPSRLLGVMMDVTESKLAAQALQRSVKEKEALLQEVHHRVKNNLQVISSLLRLEVRRSADPSTKSVLDEMQGRIRSMALLHETLYRKGDFARADLAYYLRQLATQLFSAHNANSMEVRLTLDLSEVEVPMDQAIPCGLLVNELLTNSLKHAFPAGASGEVNLSLGWESPGLVRMEVSDTGVGFPKDFETRRTQSLGLQLVSDLARQLRGELKIGPGPSAAVALIFKADGQKEAAATKT